MSRLILHVGPQKTGTSALQWFFHENAAFLARNGVAYPRTGRWIAAHHDIALACRYERAGLLHDLWKEVLGEKTVLVSSEIFSGFHDHALPYFQRHSPYRNPEIVYMLRRLPQMWYSNWTERVKHGLTLAFHDYYRNAPDNDLYSFRARPLPSRQLENLAAAFGRDALRIGIYDARSRDGDMAHRFLKDFVGVSQAPPEAVTRQINVGQTQARMECLRHLNMRAGSKEFSAEKKIRLGRLFFDDLVDIDEEILDAFETLCRKAPRFIIDNAAPEARLEMRLVLGKFGDRIVDPTESFLEEQAVSAAMIDDARLPNWLERALDKVFARFCERLETFSLPGVRRF